MPYQWTAYGREIFDLIFWKHNYFSLHTSTWHYCSLSYDISPDGSYIMNSDSFRPIWDLKGDKHWIVMQTFPNWSVSFGNEPGSPKRNLQPSSEWPSRPSTAGKMADPSHRRWRWSRSRNCFAAWGIGAAIFSASLFDRMHHNGYRMKRIKRTFRRRYDDNKNDQGTHWPHLQRAGH